MDMKNFKKTAIFFTIGGIGYGIIELLWRGRTHWSMLLAGGICFSCFSFADEKFKNRSLLFKCCFCATIITAVEFVFGLLFNILLDMKIWDYSRQPLNVLGQICPLYTVFWGFLSLLFLPLAKVLNKRIK